MEAKAASGPIQLSEPSDDLVTQREIHIVPTGEWEHWSGYNFQITPETITEIVKNFNDGVRRDIPITAGHDTMSETPAVGWFTELRDAGADGLYGTVQWNAEGLRLLTGKMFKYFSAEIDFDLHDQEDDKDYGVVLTGGALTNHPFFKQLDLDPSFGFSEAERKVAETVLMFSVPNIIGQFSKSMDLKTILAKKAEDLTADEKAFVRKHKGELDADQAAAFKDVIEEAPAETEEEKEKRIGDENEAKGLNRDGSTKTVEAHDKGKTVTLSQAEVTALQLKANEGAKAFEKIEKMELSAEVDKFVFSSSNKEGHILPKQKDAVVAFMFSLDAKQRDQFRNIMGNMPKRSSSLFTEMGTPESAATTLSDIAKEVDDGAKAIVKASNGKIKYSAAVTQLFTDKPDLKQKYDQALAEGNN
jgi:hypothetical protein